MEFDATDAARALAALPPEPPKVAPPKTSVWGAPFRAVPAAAAEMGAGLAESLKAFGQAIDAGGTAGAGGMFAGQTAQEQQQSERTRQQVLTTGMRGESEVSRSLRNVAEGYGPDPLTASKAEQVVFGLTRGIGKAVAYGTTTGPAAPFLFGLDEGLTQTDQLQRQGVDTATAAKVGTVTAGVNAAGFLIPAAGPTAVRTAALATLAGPASFVAQQAASREILRSADYTQLSQQFDPTDPWGLALSMLPFGFGAWAMRSRMRGAHETAKPEVAQEVRPAPDAIARPPEAAPAELTPVAAAARQVAAPEHVDAAMVHNLTTAADHAGTLSTAHPLEPLSEFAARTLPAAIEVRAPASADPFLAWMRQQGGASFADKFDITGEASGVRLNRGGIFKKDGLGLDELAIRAESDGWLPPGSTQDVDGGVPQLSDMLRRSMQGERILPLAEQYQRHAETAMVRADELRAEELANRLRVLGVDPAPARGNADVMAAYLDQHEPRLIRQALAEAATQESTQQVTPRRLATDAGPGAVPRAERPLAAPARPDLLGDAADPDSAAIQITRRRADQVVAEAPDLVVGHTDDGQPITAQQELERIRREAAEGTDDTLGSNEAGLIDVAAQCALSAGE